MNDYKENNCKKLEFGEINKNLIMLISVRHSLKFHYYYYYYIFIFVLFIKRGKVKR